LTGWRIDIKSETRAAEAQAELDGGDDEEDLVEDEVFVDGSDSDDGIVEDEVLGDVAPESVVNDEEARD
jgi:hypothetical protein